MTRKPLKDDDLARLRQLEVLRDEDIDTTDIPETPPEVWVLAHRGGRKAPVAVPIDAMIAAWFQRTHGDAWERAIDLALREHVYAAERGARMNGAGLDQ
jgi:uncharacterized protein (DUF4415 family)